MPPRAPLLLAPLLSAVALLITGCGDETQPGPVEAPQPGITYGKGRPQEPPDGDSVAGSSGVGKPIEAGAGPPRPDEPEEALAWVRAAHLPGNRAELRRRLALWPVDDPEFAKAEETRIVLSWRIRMALQDGSIERALEQWEHLLRLFDGHGVTPEGRSLAPEKIRLELIREARRMTRRRIEGPKPKPAAAMSAWKIGAGLLTPEDLEEGESLEAARRWAEYESLDRWLERLGWSPGAALGGSEHAKPDAGPALLVVADDVALGEPIFAGVLARWMRDGEKAGLRGYVLPILRGDVRESMRRVPAATRAEELGTIRVRAAAARLTVLPSRFAEEGARPGPALFEVPMPKSAPSSGRGENPGSALAGAIGLSGHAWALIVIDRTGRIVGRLSGTGFNARALDPVIEELVRR